MTFATRLFKSGSRMRALGYALCRVSFATAVALQGAVAQADTPPTITYLNTSSNRGITQDWDYGYYKATCGVTEALLGVSEFTDTGNGNLALCAPYSQPGSVSSLRAYVTTKSGPDKRGYARHGDWAPSYTKVECGLDQYGVGISQSTASPRVAHGIACVQGATGTDTSGITTVRQMDNNSSMGSATWGDWDPGKYKGQCIDGESIVGASFSPTTGRLHSILCRGPATLQMLYQTSSGSGVAVATLSERGTTPTVRSLGGLSPATGTAPVVTNFQGVVYALYAASSNQLCLAQSTNRGLTYATPNCLSQVSIGDTPAVAVNNGTLYVAYSSTTGPHRLMVASSTDGATFNVTSYDAITLDASPGVAVLDGVLYAGYVKSNKVCVASLQSTQRVTNVCQYSAKSQPVGMTAAFGKLFVTYAKTTGNVAFMVSDDPANVPFDGFYWSEYSTADLIAPVFYHGNLYLLFNDVTAGAKALVSVDGTKPTWATQSTTGMSATGPIGAIGTNVADTVRGVLFAVYGDMPYSDSDATLLSSTILPGLSSSANVPFILHVGDAGRPYDGTGTNPYDSCSDSFRSATVQSWWGVNQQLVFMPGDNDWTDCNTERTPRSRLDPLKEFAKVRSIFAGNVSLDAPRYATDGLNVGQPALAQTWVSNGVLYLGLNIVGSYNGYVPSTATNAAARNAEASTREAETLTAITNAGAAMASNPGLNALVVTFHVDPYTNVNSSGGTIVDWTCGLTDSTGRQPYKGICANLASVAGSIGKPMLVVHGDTVAHCFRQHPTSSNLWVLNAPGDFVPGVDLVSFNQSNASAPFSVVTMTNSAGSVPSTCNYTPASPSEASQELVSGSTGTTVQPQHIEP
ncbi:hypothetical protein [Xanthomonas sp. 3498]|uniref:hypothetical protein n=1 Tax=Xanthomonas sp. 3498 TaxID=2663863 RepID=UPI0016196E7C|nr:hypothetical protein [Xanthomonas sp. 3498]MBB5875805.1 hypothetical protein [Xanthomonas sp. 3498]